MCIERRTGLYWFLTHHLHTPRTHSPHHQILWCLATLHTCIAELQNTTLHSQTANVADPNSYHCCRALPLRKAWKGCLALSRGQLKWLDKALTPSVRLLYLKSNLKQLNLYPEQQNGADENPTRPETLKKYGRQPEKFKHTVSVCFCEQWKPKQTDPHPTPQPKKKKGQEEVLSLIVCSEALEGFNTFSIFNAFQSTQPD